MSEWTLSQGGLTQSTAINARCFCECSEAKVTENPGIAARNGIENIYR